ncbi:MAG: glycosyltransferase [Bacilli bacterium]|nr:glycosyltransferase [Bacilli bacterium]
MSTDTIRCSIAMTTCNSERFLSDQIESILAAMEDSDELVISDDASSDSTIEIIRKYMEQDSRIRLLQNDKNLGFNKNAERAYVNCRGSFIFHSDDDNVWDHNKIKTVLEAFSAHPEIGLVMHDAAIVNQDLKEIAPSFQAWRKSKPGLLHNIIRLGYGGSLLAFRRELLEYVLPFPDDMPFFADAWIGFMADKHSKSLFIPDKLSVWRRHGSNASGDNGLSQTKPVQAKNQKGKRLIQAMNERRAIWRFLKKH